MICKTIPDSENEKPNKFKLKTEKDNIVITTKIANIKHKINVKMIQFGANSIKATTGHKLQGVSLNIMFVRYWI